MIRRRERRLGKMSKASYLKIEKKSCFLEYDKQLRKIEDMTKGSIIDSFKRYGCIGENFDINTNENFANMLISTDKLFHFFLISYLKTIFSKFSFFLDLGSIRMISLLNMKNLTMTLYSRSVKDILAAFTGFFFQLNQV